MRHGPVVLLAAALFALACADGSTTGPLDPPQASLSSQACDNVNGTIAVQLISPTNGVGTATGDLAGTVSVSLTGGGPKGQGANAPLLLTLSHTFITANGTIFTVDNAVLAPSATPEFTASVRYDVVGGTGLYADASGFIRTHGTVNLGTGVIDLRYDGRVCR